MFGIKLCMCVRVMTSVYAALCVYSVMHAYTAHSSVLYIKVLTFAISTLIRHRCADMVQHNVPYMRFRI